MPDPVRPESPATTGPTPATGMPTFPEPISSGGAPGPPAGIRPGGSALRGPEGPAGDLSEPVEATPGGYEDPPSLRIERTRTSSTYLSVGVLLLVLVLVIIFIAQNLRNVSVHFLAFDFRFPLGLVILGAAVAGGLIVLMISLARLLQLRLMARRHRKAHDRS